MRKSLQDAIQIQWEWARQNGPHTHDVYIRLYTSLLDIETELESVWTLTDEIVARVAAESEIMKATKVPAPILLAGRYRELAQLTENPTAKEQADGLKTLKRVRDDRAHFINVVEHQARVWDKIAERYDSAVENVRSRAEKDLKAGNFVVHFVEIENGAISLQGQEFLTGLIPALADRSALARTISKETGDLINKLRIDLKAFDNALAIGEWLSPVGAALPNFDWKDPSEIMAKYGREAAVIREGIVQANIQAFEKSGALADEAARIARHNARIGRLQGALALAGDLAALGRQLAGGGERAESATIGGARVPVPKPGSAYIYMYKLDRAGNGWVHERALEVGSDSLLMLRD